MKSIYTHNPRAITVHKLSGNRPRQEHQLTNYAEAYVQTAYQCFEVTFMQCSQFYNDIVGWLKSELPSSKVEIMILLVG